jgi:hypothetical protein
MFPVSLLLPGFTVISDFSSRFPYLLFFCAFCVSGDRQKAAGECRLLSYFNMLKTGNF